MDKRLMAGVCLGCAVLVALCLSGCIHAQVGNM